MGYFTMLRINSNFVNEHFFDTADHFVCGCGRPKERGLQ